MLTALHVALCISTFTPRRTKGGPERVDEDRTAGPAEIASTRIDFSDWLDSLKRRDRRLAVRGQTGAVSHFVFGGDVGRLAGAVGIDPRNADQGAVDSRQESLAVGGPVVHPARAGAFNSLKVFVARSYNR